MAASEDYSTPYTWKPNGGDETRVGDIRAWKSGPYEYTYVGGNHPLAIANHTLMMHYADRSKGDTMLSQLMLGHDGRISSIETNPEERRKGHATRLINFAKTLSEKYEDFPTPKWSDNRTPEGNALAKSMGEDDIHPVVSEHQFVNRRGW